MSKAWLDCAEEDASAWPAAFECARKKTHEQRLCCSSSADSLCSLAILGFHLVSLLITVSAATSISHASACRAMNFGPWTTGACTYPGCKRCWSLRALRRSVFCCRTCDAGPQGPARNHGVSEEGFRRSQAVAWEHLVEMPHLPILGRLCSSRPWTRPQVLSGSEQRSWPAPSGHAHLFGN